MLRCSFPKFNVWIFAWFALVPLFAAIKEAKPLKVVLYSFLCGFLFWVMTIFWLVNVTATGMIVLSAYLSLYFVLFASGYRFLRDRLKFWQRLLFVPCLWVAMEFARGLLVSGFPWALLAYSQTSNLAALQVADICGAFGVSFLIVFSNVFIFEIIGELRAKKSVTRARIVVPLVIILAWFGYGGYRIFESPKIVSSVRIAVVQGNIPQEIKWVSSFRENIFKKYQLLSEISRLKNEPDLMIWPETSFPDYFEFGADPVGLKSFISSMDVPLLAGSIRLDKAHYYNSALLFASNGALAGIYDKIHLVPFGEYLPLRTSLPFLAQIVPIEDFTPGEALRIFSVRGRSAAVLKFGVLICFEDILSDLARGFVSRGADFLVNMTNDAWFGDTASPYQHMQASVLRAIENRVYVVRAANTGISCIIDDVGRLVTSVRDESGKEAFVTGHAGGVVMKTSRRSCYSKIGDLFALICSACVVLFVFLFGVSQGRRVR